MRNFLVKLIWDPNIQKGDYIIYFISRGAPGNIESVRGNSVKHVYLRGFEAESENRVLYIPFHRIVLIKNDATGEIVYKKGY